MTGSTRLALATVLLPTLAAAEEPTPTLELHGYVETFFQVHLQNPSNRITNLRGFDNRSRTFTLSNVALDVKADKGPITTRVILQIGHTPSSYYLVEPVSLGTSSVDTSSSELWKYLQAANVTARLPQDWVLEAGLFASPIGFEAFAIKDNGNWSRSNLFFGLPFYHTGAMLSHPLADGVTGKLHVYSGWNSVVDNNGIPSVAASVSYASSTTTAQALYFGGIERPDGAPEGRAWRHLVDAYVVHTITDQLALGVQADAGIEPNDIGTSAWLAGAVLGKLALRDDLHAALRGDYFYERVAEAGGMRASPIFWPTRWVASGTATLAFQPVDNASIRLEYRHDHAASDAFFGGDVAFDPMTLAYTPNRDRQDTLTLGAVAWF